MKFAEHLSAHITPEWRKQYIQYEAMKDMLYQATEEAPSAEGAEQDLIERHYARFDEMFLQFCDKELLKINTFFSEKLAEATRKFASLKSDLDALQETSSQKKSNRFMSQLRSRTKDEDQAPKVKFHDLKLAFTEFYLSLILLQNYQSLNFTGFRKILKKHDKLLQTNSGAKWREAHVETAPFYTTKQVDQLIKETENVFTERMERGDRQRAMKRLRVPPLGEQQNVWTAFRMGLFLGIFCVLVVVAIFVAWFVTPDKDWLPVLRMYRGMFLVILFVFLLGINTYGWRAAGVNHVLIFELDPRDHLTFQQYLEVASCFAVLWALSLLSYLLSNFINIPPFLNPLCLAVFFIVYLFNPIRILHFTARWWLIRIMFRIVTAPFHYVGFADFWLADQLNSLSTVLMDLEYMICYYAFEVDWFHSKDSDVCNSVSYGIRPIIACLPAWFRFAQCLRRYRDTRLFFPHIVNAGKYSTSFFVVIFSSLYQAYIDQHGMEVIQNNAFFYLWILSAVVSTIYTYTWDIKMDWGLLDKHTGDNRFLREEIVYAHKAYYYLSMVADLILRFTWTVTVSIGEGGLINGEILRTILATLEVFRRFVWNFFRLENEHLNNCGQFRAVRDISIGPITANDLAIMERYMDEDEGVTKRHQDRPDISHAPKSKKKEDVRTPLLHPDDED